MQMEVSLAGTQDPQDYWQTMDIREPESSRGPFQGLQGHRQESPCLVPVPAAVRVSGLGWQPGYRALWEPTI